MRNAYLRPANIDVSVKRARNFCINKQNGKQQRRSNVRKCFASRERLRLKDVIGWISKRSVWTDTNGVHGVGNLRFQSQF